MTQIPATYSDAATRGKLRLWKEAQAKRWRRFDRAYRNDAAFFPHIVRIMQSGAVGRRRAFDKICKALGPGVTLEGVRLEGKWPVAVFSILRPRHSVIIEMEEPDPAMMQNCVTVDYVVVGTIPGIYPNAGKADGFWSIEIPDHALGRAIERSGMLPDAIIREAHHNILRLRCDTVIPNKQVDPKRTFLVKAGAGGFVTHLQCGPDVSLGETFAVRARAHTWIANDMLHADQVLLADDGEPGHRLGDQWLIPAPLRRVVRTGNVLECGTWPGLLPDLLSQAKGHA
jgi:hypothetical protein